MTNFDAAAQLSKATAAAEESAILVMARKARALKEHGVDVASLTIGEPDFDTPEEIKHAAKRALDSGHTHYAPIPGTPAVRRAIADKLARENNVLYDPSEITVSNGAKQSITNACFAMLDPGDEVLLISPFWVAYEGIARMAGGTCRTVYAGIDQGFKITPRQLQDALGEKTKLVFLNNPGNPSGAVYSFDELKALAQVIAAHPSAMVISDEIYEYIAFDDTEPVSFASLPGMRERTITINGLSKGFAMTGWRLGYAAAPQSVANAMAKVQGTFTAGANAFVQEAAAAALNGPRDEVVRMCAIYRERRDLMTKGLGLIKGLKFSPPAGTFYAFVDVSAYYGRSSGNHAIHNSAECALWLLEAHHVAVVPGIAFGDDRCLRLSFASNEATIVKGLERMAAAFDEFGLPR